MFRSGNDTRSGSGSGRTARCGLRGMARAHGRAAPGNPVQRPVGADRQRGGWCVLHLRQISQRAPRAGVAGVAQMRPCGHGSSLSGHGARNAGCRESAQCKPELTPGYWARHLSRNQRAITQTVKASSSQPQNARCVWANMAPNGPAKKNAPPKDQPPTLWPALGQKANSKMTVRATSKNSGISGVYGG